MAKEFTELMHELILRELLAKAEKAEHEAEQARLSLAYTRKLIERDGFPSVVGGAS